MADKLLGKDFVLLAGRGGKMIPVCCGRDLTISISAETIEVTKAPQSRWKGYIYGDNGYSISTSGLTTLDTSFTVNDFYNAINNRETLAFVALNEADGNLFFSGNILITGVDVSGGYKDPMTYSISAIGDGPLSNANPYEINIITDVNGDAIVDENGDVLVDFESGDLLPINYDINC